MVWCFYLYFDAGGFLGFYFSERGELYCYWLITGLYRLLFIVWECGLLLVVFGFFL